MKYSLLLALAVGLFCGCNHQSGPDTTIVSNASECARRLALIDGAKQKWAEENQKTPSDTPSNDDLKAMLRGVPGCPAGGVYTITHVGELSTCSIPEHTAAYKKLAASGPATPAQ